MPLDPRIPGMVAPPQPFNGLAQLADVRAQQQQLQLRDQQIRSNQALEAERRQQIGARQQAAADTATIDDVMQHAFTTDPETGVSTFNRQLVQDGLLKGGKGHLLPTMTEHLDALDKSTATMVAARNDMVARTLIGIGDAGDTMESLVSGAAYLKKNGAITDDHIAPILEAAKADPTPQNIGALRQRLGQNLPQYQTLLTAQAKSKGDLAKTTADTAKTVRETELLGQLTPAQAAANAATLSGQTETARHNRATERQAAAATAGADTAVALTPEALTLTAKQFAMTGQLPPMGMGKQGASVRTKIINEAAKQYAGLDLPSQVAAYTASKESLKKIQGQRDAMGAFEETALKNLDVFMGAASKVVDTGSPLLNKSLRSMSGALMGSPEMTAYNTARRTVIPEFAKILANPGLSGQLSDSARKEIEDVVSGDATLAQTYAAAKVLKTDAANRRTAYDDQIKAIQERIARPPGSPAAATPAAGGKITVTAPDGSTHPFATQAEADAFKRLAGIK